MMGLGRTGSYAHNGSGDYIIAFLYGIGAAKAQGKPGR